MNLIAVWKNTKDEYYDPPTSVYWSDGSPATLKDYDDHRLDTRKLIDDGPRGHQLYIWPDIVAEVYFCPWGKNWGMRGNGVKSCSLGLTDRDVTEDQIVAALSAFPITYRHTTLR
jgi:hypothetical protein